MRRTAKSSVSHLTKSREREGIPMPATKVVMPKMGYDMEEGKIVNWLKKVGDQVQKGDAIAEIETEKVNIQIEAFTAGVLQQILVQEGDTVPVGEAIAEIATEGEAPAETEAIASDAAAPPTDRQDARQRDEPVEEGADVAEPAEAPPGSAEMKESPMAERQEAALSPGPSGVPAKSRDLSRMGQAIARRMADSKRNIPHFYATIQVDMAAVSNLRQELNRALSEDSKISVNDFIMKAAALALTRYPILNGSYAERKVHLYQEINVAMAIALEGGLIAPVIKNCDQKPLAQIAREAKNLAKGSKEGSLRQDEFEGATFTVTNMGMLGIDEFAAIINPPQAAILAVGSVAPRPVVRDGALAVSETMIATLSVDHRVANGADGARFLQEFQRMLEDPLRLVL
jgi:pyruvate dehydrogenase E2 component (dihydrolipoamide acetyltransferase)